MPTEKRLIDANALIKKINHYYNNSPFPHPGTTWTRGLELAVGLILNEPTVDAVEMKTLEAWLYQIAMNNIGTDFGEAVEEIIDRLDGLRVFAKERKDNG